ncbi:helix-turn-helix domain-containing protein [Streptomyces sp. NPDC059985]|uniref:helix-turn-helix domain-containing protein n=1 Tax=Streptomyces sp. NPDC059985 TaxID=3347025 RepID=UPI0036CAFDA4
MNRSNRAGLWSVLVSHAHHGTTWSDAVEAVRRDRITRLLHDTDLTFDAVATRSGHADARAPRRAVHRWYGTTPAALRRAGRLRTPRGRREFDDRP